MTIKEFMETDCLDIDEILLKNPENKSKGNREVISMEDWFKEIGKGV